MNATNPTVDAEGRRCLRDAYFYGSGLLSGADGDMLMHADALELSVRWIDGLPDSGDGARLEALLPGLVDSLRALVTNWRKVGPGQAIRKTQVEQAATERLSAAMRRIAEVIGDSGLPLNWKSEPWRYREHVRANQSNESASKEAAELAWRRSYPCE